MRRNKDYIASMTSALKTEHVTIFDMEVNWELTRDMFATNTPDILKSTKFSKHHYI